MPVSQPLSVIVGDPRFDALGREDKGKMVDAWFDEAASDMTDIQRLQSLSQDRARAIWLMNVAEAREEGQFDREIGPPPMRKREATDPEFLPDEEDLARTVPRSFEFRGRNVGAEGVNFRATIMPHPTRQIVRFEFPEGVVHQEFPDEIPQGKELVEWVAQNHIDKFPQDSIVSDALRQAGTGLVEGVRSVGETIQLVASEMASDAALGNFLYDREVDDRGQFVPTKEAKAESDRIRDEQAESNIMQMAGLGEGGMMSGPMSKLSAAQRRLEKGGSEVIEEGPLAGKTKGEIASQAIRMFQQGVRDENIQDILEKSEAVKQGMERTFIFPRAGNILAAQDRSDAWNLFGLEVDPSGLRQDVFRTAGRAAPAIAAGAVATATGTLPTFLPAIASYNMAQEYRGSFDEVLGSELNSGKDLTEAIDAAMAAAPRSAAAAGSIEAAANVFLGGQISTARQVIAQASKPVRASVARVLAAGAVEGGTEGVQSLISSVINDVYTEEDREVGDIGRQAAYEALVGLFVGSGISTPGQARGLLLSAGTRPSARTTEQMQDAFVRSGLNPRRSESRFADFARSEAARNPDGDFSMSLPEGSPTFTSGADVDYSTLAPDIHQSSRSRASHYQDVFTEEGLTPDEAVLKPIGEQVDIAAGNVQRTFSFREVDTESNLQGRDVADNLMDARASLQDMANLIGLPSSAMGLGGTLTLSFGRRRNGALGFYDNNSKSVTVLDRNTVFGHEWAHGLDYWLFDNSAGEAGPRGGPRGATGARRGTSSKISDVLKGKLDESFNKVMRALFFDKASEAKKVRELELRLERARSPKSRAEIAKKLARITEGSSQIQGIESSYRKEAKKLDGDKGSYWRRPTELFARAFESYLAHKIMAAGGEQAFTVFADRVVSSDVDEMIRRAYPQGEDRARIFEAFDELFGELARIEAFAGKVPERASDANMLDPTKWPQRSPEDKSWAQDISEILEKERTALARRRRQLEKEGKGKRQILTRLNSMRAAWLSAIRTHFNVIARRYKNNPQVHNVVIQIKDLMAAEPGGKRLVEQAYQEEVEMEIGRKDTQAVRAVADQKIDPELMSAKQSRDLRDLLVNAEDADPNIPDDMRRAAARLRRLLDEEYRNNVRNGIEIGFTRNGFLPRIYSQKAAWDDQQGFLEAAAQVYELMKDRQIAEIDAALAEAAAEEKAELQARRKAVEKLDPSIQAEGWLNRLLYGDDSFFDRQGPDHSYTESRRLPEEADSIMRDFMVNDPMDAIFAYFDQSTRRIAWAKRFGAKNEKLDEMKRQLRVARMHPDDMEELGGLIERSAGIYRGNLTRRGQVFASWVHTFGTMTMLTKAVFASIAEPMTIGIRSGRVTEPLRVIYNSARDIGRTRDARQLGELAEYLGIIADPSVDQMMANRFGGAMTDSVKARSMLTTFFRRTGLTGLTRHQRRVALASGMAYLKWISRRYNEGGANRQQAENLFNELGISEHSRFAQWMVKTGKMPTIDELARSPLQQQFATATNRFVRQAIQNPEAVDRPFVANSPLGRILYSIMSFNLAFYENVLKGTARRIKNTPGSRMTHAAIGVLPAAASLYALQTLISSIRYALTNREKWEEQEGDDFFDKMMQPKSLARGATRAFPPGVVDPILQGLYGLKYERDLATTLSGAHLSYFAEAFAAILGYMVRNSEKTNTAERNLTMGAYEAFVSPALTYALTRAPGGPLIGGLYGLMMMAGTSQTAKGLAADLVAGEKER